MVNKDMYTWYSELPQTIKPYFKPLIKVNMRKIVFSGPSGSGKTTLAKEISSLTGIPYYPLSAQTLLGSEDEVELMAESNGLFKIGMPHYEVIKLGNIYPRFSALFQGLVLEKRLQFFKTHTEFIVDRSLLDNVVYYLLQTAFHMDEPSNKAFLAKVLKGINDIEVYYLLNINPNNSIENDGQRIISPTYQRLVYNTFEYVIQEIRKHVITEVIIINEWSFDYRREFVGRNLGLNL